MTAFSIRFGGGTANDYQPEPGRLLGEIVLGDYREYFESAIGYWSPAEYQRQWRTGVQRAVATDSASCLITSITDPLDADVLRWWLLYPRGEVIAVQEHLLLLRQLAHSFVQADPYRSIPPRKLRTDEDDAISEWEISRDALRDFLDTLNRG